MDAFVPALIAAALAELGDKAPWLAAILAARFGARAVIAGAVLAVGIGSAASGVLGALLQPLIGPDARLLFLGMALGITGLLGLLPLRAPDPLARWRIGGFATSAVGLLILQFGEGTQFLVMAIAANAKAPALAAIGGAIGSLAVIVPMTLAGVALRDRLPLSAVRLGSAIVFLLAGLVAAVSALGIG